MKLLVAIATLITFFYSIYLTFLGDSPTFETCCMLISFISFGEYIEGRAKDQTNDVVNDLIDLVPTTVKRIKGINSDIDLLSNYGNGNVFKLEDVKLDDLEVDDYIFIGQGQSIPADSFVILGEIQVDESMLTGESDLVTKSCNETVTGGTVVVKGQAISKVIHKNEESTLSKIIEAVKDAQNSKAPIARIADKIAGIFVPCVLGLGLLVFAL